MPVGWRPFKRCKLCRRWRWWPAFVWRDKSGNAGVSRRCHGCRGRGYRRNPALPPVERYRIRPHAVRRYIQRCRPELKYTEARDEMIMLMEGAPFLPPTDAPPWCRPPAYLGKKPTNIGFLLIDPDTVFALSRYRTSVKGEFYEKVSTVLTAGGDI